MVRTFKTAALILSLVLAACGDDDGGAADADPSTPDGSGTVADADPSAPDGNGLPGGPDAGIPTGCGLTECTDCIDNDGDGPIDGDDPECISSIDDDESSFATGIPGDNNDEKKQDCFFDGDSGGNCQINTCCLLEECPDGFMVPDPGECEVSASCIEECIDIVPPGCDCFGCCTVCNDMGCFDIFTNPALSPDCTAAVAHDPELCPPCNKSVDCNNPCDPENCILCPGQDPDDLPDDCVEQECPDGAPTCDLENPCGADQFCSNGCCIPDVE